MSAAMRAAHRATFAACAQLAVRVPERERSLDLLDDAQTAVMALRGAGHHDVAARCIRALTAAEDAELRAAPTETPISQGMRWPDCTQWLGRSAA